MSHTVRRRSRSLTTAATRTLFPCALIAAARPDLAKISGDAVLLLPLVLLAGLVLAVVVLAAVFSDKPARRRAALAVLDRLLRWKG